MEKTLLFDRYEIIKEIGKGAFSRVYLVRDTHLCRLMALKKITGQTDEHTELDALKELSGESFPVVYDYRQDEEAGYIFMEYVEGRTLREYLAQNGKVDTQRCIEWAGALAGILMHLHKQKPSVIYRDLKPENIMIKPDGSIKLIDFGGILKRSRSLDEQRGNYATKGYSAPELFGPGKPEPSADIYSLGAIMHEMLTGDDPNKPPFVRKNIKDVDRSIPEGLVAIIQRCLEKDPQKRYQSMEDMIKDLNNYRLIRIKRLIPFSVKKLLSFGFTAAFVLSVLLPLVKGIPKDEFPFPYLDLPLFLLSVNLILHASLARLGNKYEIKCIKKDICLSEKTYMGLMGMTFFLAGALIAGSATKLFTMDVRASEPAKDMWVSICDEQERKVLVKNEKVMDISDKVRLEIQKDDIPQDAVTIQVIAVAKDGSRYQSRGFRVKKTP